MFDRRGTGLSDHTTASGDRLALPQLARDVAAVLDASDTPRAVLLGASLGAMTGIQFASDYPERTAGARPDRRIAPGDERAPAYDFGLDPDEIDAWVDQVDAALGHRACWSTSYAPAMSDDERFREWAARQERHTCSPGMAAASMRWAARYDVRDLLPTCRHADARDPPRRRPRRAGRARPVPRRPHPRCDVCRAPRARTTRSSSATSNR